jgi:hypothetical protein
MLPKIPYTHGTQKLTQAQFGGLDMRAGAPGGSIKYMLNMTGDNAPLLSSRRLRYSTGQVTKPNGIFSDGEHLIYADGTALYVDGVSAGTVEDSEKTFAALGERVLIWPDKKIWTQADGLQSLESTVSTSCTFENGTYAEEPAEGNTIKAASNSYNWGDYFKVGDAVTVTGADDEENNKTAIVREIEGRYLRFYENTFKTNSTSQFLTVSREVPDLDFICVNENRVWGCKGDEIRSSKLGDPFNWNVFDGLSTDSYSVMSGTGGDFTACVSYTGYPVFFKQEHIFKIYGSKPTNFELMGSATLGVLPGAHRSLAIAGETLYYLSHAGIVAYTGGMPQQIGAELGEMKITGAVSGSDGIKYYTSVLTSSGERHLLVYDTSKGMWHREDELNVLGFAYLSGHYAQTAGAIMLLGSPVAVPPDATPEGPLSSSVTFADVDGGNFDSKYPVRLWLRAEADAGVVIRVYISHDGGEYVLAATCVPGSKKSGYFPVPIKRCDHYSVKIEATGGAWKLYAMETELYAGSESRKG